jgi:glucose-fructose oxidoreductase
VLVGSAGTISSFDYETTIRVQTNEHPQGMLVDVDEVQHPNQNAIQYFVDCLKHGRSIEGPLSPEFSRIGQQIVDTAYQSALQKRTLPLLS